MQRIWFALLMMPLGEQKAGRQLGITAGSTLVTETLLSAEANLERFFDGQEIFFTLRSMTDDFANRDANCTIPYLVPLLVPLQLRGLT